MATIDQTRTRLHEFTRAIGVHLVIPKQLQMRRDSHRTREQRAFLPGAGALTTGDHQAHGGEFRREEAAIHACDGCCPAHAFGDAAAARPVVRLVDDLEVKLAAVEDHDLQVKGMVLVADGIFYYRGVADERLAVEMGDGGPTECR